MELSDTDWQTKISRRRSSLEVYRIVTIVTAYNQGTSAFLYSLIIYNYNNTKDNGSSFHNISPILLCMIYIIGIKRKSLSSTGERITSCDIGVEEGERDDYDILSPPSTLSWKMSSMIIVLLDYFIRYIKINYD